MNRTNFYQKIEVSGTTELDFLRNSLSGFEMKYKPSYLRITDAHVMRPDRISFVAYGTVNFWWVICLVNHIDSPLTELVEGQVLMIPNKLDVYTFQKKYRLRRSV